MAKPKSIRAARPRIEGSTDQLGGKAFNPDHYDDDVQYDVVLSGVVNFPEGSENWLQPDSDIKLSGKAVKLIGGDKIKSAVKLAEPEPVTPTEYPSKTNLFSVKGFKGHPGDKR